MIASRSPSPDAAYFVAACEKKDGSGATAAGGAAATAAADADGAGGSLGVGAVVGSAAAVGLVGGGVAGCNKPAKGSSDIKLASHDAFLALAEVAGAADAEAAADVGDARAAADAVGAAGGGRAAARDATLGKASPPPPTRSGAWPAAPMCAWASRGFSSTKAQRTACRCSGRKELPTRGRRPPPAHVARKQSQAHGKPQATPGHRGSSFAAVEVVNNREKYRKKEIEER